MILNKIETTPFKDYGALEEEISFEIDYEFEFDKPAPFLNEKMRRWSVVEKLKKTYFWRTRAVSDCSKVFNCKCMFSTLMLSLFISLLIIGARTILFNKAFGPPAYDFIIVGGGSAGSIVTRKLVDSGARVLLLEAGEYTDSETTTSSHLIPTFSIFDIPILWSAIINLPKFTWTGFQSSDIIVGKGLGGSGFLNSMIYLRGLASDLEKWKLPGWNWETILSHYRSLEKYQKNSLSESIPIHYGGDGLLGISKPVYYDLFSKYFVEASQNSNISFLEDFNDPNSVRNGVGFYHFLIEDGERASASKACLEDLLISKSPKLDLEMKATVRRILFNRLDNTLLPDYEENLPYNKLKAYGVEYEQDGVVKTALLGLNSAFLQSSKVFEDVRSVILTSGAIMTPKILMNSGIGDPEELKNANIDSVLDNFQVGKNLHDHPAVPIIMKTSSKLAASLPSTFMLADQLINYFQAVDNLKANDPALNRTQTLEKLGVLASTGFSAGAFLSSPYAANDKEPDLQLTVYPVSIVTNLLKDKPFFPHLSPSIHDTSVLVSVTLLSPDRRKKVLLNATDPFDSVPYIINEVENSTSLSDRDLSILVWGIRRAREIFASPPLDGMLESEILPGINMTDEDIINWIPQAVYSSSNWVGTAKMGADPMTSVTDPKFRVWGVKSLHIADASVIPIVPSGNIQATVLAMASIAADSIISSVVD